VAVCLKLQTFSPEGTLDEVLLEVILSYSSFMVHNGYCRCNTHLNLFEYKIQFHR